MKVRRIIIYSSVILICLCICIGIFATVRGQMLVTRTYSINKNAINKLRIVAITDLHGNARGSKRDVLVERIREVNPEVIVYLGDMIDQEQVEESIQVVLSLTETLTDVAPVYYVDGNHEQDLKINAPEVYNRLMGGMKEFGAVQLENETVSLKSDNYLVNICGISTHYYWGDEEYALTAKLRAMEGINVLMCHYPESVIWYDAFDGGGIDVALCGHTHGGLVRVPFKGGLYAPEQGRWPMYDLGAYPIYTDTTWRSYGGGDGAEYLGTLIISGGLAGEHGVPRMNNPREVSVVDIGDM